MRSGTFRPLFKPFYWLFVINFLMLMYLGAAAGRDLGVHGRRLGKIGVVYYFAYFIIILPLLGASRRPGRCRASISESVLGKRPARDARTETK